MYAIIVYDVDVSRNRAILTYLRTHLNWIQNSVFEGELTEAEFREVKTELEDLSEEQDSIVIYALALICSSEYFFVSGVRNWPQDG